MLWFIGWLVGWLVGWQGDILIGIEILTELEADAKPAGFGRSSPNMHPELPPPTGRIKLVRVATLLSRQRGIPVGVTAHLFVFVLPQRALWNPLYVLETFLGPAMCRRIVCALIVVFIGGILVFGGPLLSAAMPAFTFAMDLPSPVNYVALAGIGVLIIMLCGCLCACMNKCRRMATGLPGMDKKKK